MDKKADRKKIRRSFQPLGTFLGLLSGFCLWSGCGTFTTRPDRHLSYAETAFAAAQRDGADLVTPQTFQLARETLFRARAAYRAKNFKVARHLAIRARLLAEEAEFKTKNRDAKASDNPVSATDSKELL